MSILSSYDDVIRAVAERNDVPFELVKQLLALESDFGNLHGISARPALRRAIGDIIDAALTESDPK
jgi:membrane-bound lytic murein transglycosylase B